MWFTEEELNQARLNTVVVLEVSTPRLNTDTVTETNSKRKPTRSRPRKGLAPLKKIKSANEMESTFEG